MSELVSDICAIVNLYTQYLKLITYHNMKLMLLMMSV